MFFPSPGGDLLPGGLRRALANCLAEVVALYPVPSCHAVLNGPGGAVLLVQRRRDPFAGHWGLPGGKVEWGETVAEALAREVREETGLAIGPPRLVTYRDALGHGPDGRLHWHFVMFFFAAEVAGGRLRAGDDAAAARWVDATELDTLPLVPELRDILAAARANAPFR